MKTSHLTGSRRILRKNSIPVFWTVRLVWHAGRVRSGRTIFLEFRGKDVQQPGADIFQLVRSNWASKAPSRRVASTQMSSNPSARSLAGRTARSCSNSAHTEQRAILGHARSAMPRPDLRIENASLATVQLHSVMVRYRHHGIRRMGGEVSPCPSRHCVLHTSESNAVQSGFRTFHIICSYDVHSGPIEPPIEQSLATQ